MKLKIFAPALGITLILAACSTNNKAPFDTTNFNSHDRMLIVLSAPSVNDPYYTDILQQTIDMEVGLANAIIGNDNVVVIADSATMPMFEGRLPADVLLTGNVNDSKIREFATVNPNDAVKFKYKPAYLDASEAEADQNSFESFGDVLGLDYASSSLILDGGNFISDNNSKIIVTERFLEDNNLTESEARTQLKDVTGATEVAIIPYNEDVMGQADGILMFADDNTIIVNTYNEPYRTELINSIKNQISNVEIVEINSTQSGAKWNGVPSSCGNFVDGLVTKNYIYIPSFGDHNDLTALQSIQPYTFKAIMNVPIDGVCFAGLSIRNLTWEVAGKNAQKIIEAAQQD